MINFIISIFIQIIDLVTDCCCKNALLDSYFTGLYEIIDKIIKTTFNTKVRGKKRKSQPIYIIEK